MMTSDPITLAKPVASHVAADEPYQLDNQIGYLLRLANQRHLEIFSDHIPSLTPTQFSVLVRLNEVGDLSQNELGRRIGIDGATTNGVIERLVRKGLIKSAADNTDRRRLRISLTAVGRKAVKQTTPLAQKITTQTLAGLNATEAKQLTALLIKLQAS